MGIFYRAELSKFKKEEIMDCVIFTVSGLC